MLPPTGIEPMPFRNSASKVAGLQVHATTPGSSVLAPAPLSLPWLKEVVAVAAAIFQLKEKVYNIKFFH